MTSLSLFRLASVLVPFLLSFTALFVFLSLVIAKDDEHRGMSFLQSVKWSLSAPGSAMRLLAIVHMIPAAIQALLLIILSCVLRLPQLSTVFWAVISASLLAIVAIYLYVLFPEITGGRARSTAIFGIIVGVPIFASLAAIVGVVAALILTKSQ